MSDLPRRPLRTGYTTGSCATTAALAAARYLLEGSCPTRVEILLPRQRRLRLPLAYCEKARDNSATAGVIKDAGDDPDVTHGAMILSRVELRPRPGLSLHAAEGVGTVYNKGLPIPPGEAAINPVPRRLIAAHLARLAERCGYQQGFRLSVGVEDGARLARSTMNARLGIRNGLSILGTTGIVRPFSCAAWIASVRQAIDVACANGHQHLGVATGSSSEEALRREHQLPEMALIEMGDFVGAALKQLRRYAVPRLSLAGGFAKLSKLAAGHSYLHSSHSAVDHDFLAALARRLGAGAPLCAAVRAAPSAGAVLQLCQEARLPIAQALCRCALEQTQALLGVAVQLDVLLVGRSGQLLAQLET